MNRNDWIEKYSHLEPEEQELLQDGWNGCEEHRVKPLQAKCDMMLKSILDIVNTTMPDETVGKWAREAVKKYNE